MNERTAALLDTVSGATLSSVMTSEVPNFLFDGCFRDRSITVFVAPPHRGKTLLMLDMAICLDAELPLFGRFAPMRGHEVFFLGCDAPAWDYGLQARKLCIGHGLDASKRELLGVNGVWRRGLKITDTHTQKFLRAWRAETGASVLFIDTHRATHSANENDSREMERVWDILCSMRDQGWCIIMSHHTSKPSEVLQEDVNAPRGSTVIGASADFIYNLSKRNRHDPKVQMVCTKGRGSGGEDDPLAFFTINYRPCDEEVNGRPIKAIRLLADAEDIASVIVAGLPATRRDIEALVRSQCPVTIKDMSDAQVGKLVDNRLQELRRNGRITTDGASNWRLIEESP